MSPRTLSDAHDGLELTRKYTPRRVGLEPIATTLTDPAAMWAQGSSAGERRFVDDLELALLDQLDEQVVTRDVLLAELEKYDEAARRAALDFEQAQRRVRQAEEVARGTRAGFEVLARRNTPRPDRWPA